MAKTSDKRKNLTSSQREELLKSLKDRFEKNMNRHKDLKWADVLERLESSSDKLWSLHEMERTGGEPDLVQTESSGESFTFYDCSKQSPKGRRSICYDQDAREARKKHKPESSALEMAKSMGIEILSEDQYRKLQAFGPFDTTTSSWILTPKEIRELGGALFCDYRYETIFTYHNGAESYYGARGFRGLLSV